MAESRTTVIDAQGRVEIPASVRKQLGLQPGTELVVLVEDGALTLMTRDSAISRAQRLVADALGDTRKSLVDELITDRRREAERE